MVKHIFLGFRNGKLQTVVISNSNEVEDAIDCDYFTDHPQEPKKQVVTWLGTENWE